MQRTKVEKWIYNICKKTDAGFVPVAEITSDEEIKTKAKQKEVLSDYPDCVLILVGTETATYEMSDEDFFAHATRK